MPISYREVEYKRNKRFDKKIDKREPIRAVIVDSLGNDSGSGSIWADENLRRVWIRELGTAGASQIPCYNITPVIGLGVIVGYEPYSDIREVLSSDKKFLGQTNPDGRSYESPSTMDFRPGGRFQLWLASKLIEPLATYPSSATGLTVNVVVGDYPYAGTRKTFAGQANVPLTQNPNAGQHYYAGLYLDAANTLQIVYGASVVLATTPPEPAWPAGAFRLSVVRINDTQTNITLSTDTDTDNDIFDRRMPWSDTNSGGNVWPKADQNMLDGVNYTTVTLLIAAMGSGDIGHLGERTSVEAVTLNVASVTLRGVGASATIFQGIFSITATSSRVREISIDSSGANARGFDIHINGTAILEDCEASCFGTTTSRALDVSTPGAGATVTVIGGRYEGLGTLPFDIYADTDCTIILQGPILAGGLIGGPGLVTGHYYDDEGNFYLAPGTDFTVQSAVTPNPIINGSFLFWQRGTSFAAVASGARTADRFGYGAVGAMVHTISRSTDVPTVAQAEVLTPYSFLVDCTTVDASIAAGDFAYLYHVIEGSNFAGLAQRAITLSFWVKATKTGVYCVSFRNAGADRSYVAEYTINTTDTWEPKTITALASPSAGTWDYATGAGLLIGFALAAGTTFHTTAGTWQTGSFLSTANQVNAVDSTSNNFHLALVKIEPGAIATPFVMPDIGQELARCQRYYEKSYDLATALGTNTGAGVAQLNTRTAIAASTSGVIRHTTNFLVPKRTGPTVVIYAQDGTINAITNSTALNNRTGAAGSTPSEKMIGQIAIDNTSANAIALDALLRWHYTADAEF